MEGGREGERERGGGKRIREVMRTISTIPFEISLSKTYVHHHDSCS